MVTNCSRLLIGAAIVFLTTPTNAQDGAGRSTSDGVFTAAQARRGAVVNDEVCVECHEVEEFTGSFMDSWVGAPVSMLFEDISTLMPDDRPGALPSQQYADVLAYIFELNGLPAGDRELSTDMSELSTIIIEWSGQ